MKPVIVKVNWMPTCALWLRKPGIAHARGDERLEP
jgi:hypothetical protein